MDNNQVEAMWVTIREAHRTRSMLLMEVNLEQAGKTTGNRNMSTIVRKTASRHGEEYLEMNLGVGVEIEGNLRHLVL